jgi:sarcosine oxidase subunit delta
MKRPPPPWRIEADVMLLIRCPYCEMERPEVEFKYAGQAHLTRAPETASDEEWTDFLYFRDNTRGMHAERWRHTVGCGRFFNCLRDTVSDKIAATYKFGERRPAAP